MEFKHIPVLLNEVIENLNIKPDGKYLDCTVGGAGHSTEIAKKLNKNGILVCFDRDEDAICASSSRLSNFCNVHVLKNDEEFKNFVLEKSNKPTAIICKTNYNDAESVLKELKLEKFDGILIDLGVSSHQIDTKERGFSFRQEGKLDMRMDTSSLLTASDIVNTYTESELAEIFFKFGEEEFSRSIARNIVKEREKSPIETTTQLAAIIEKSMPAKVVYSRGGASKKVFQALRIVVNNELEPLSKTIDFLSKSLNFGGRICVITFHSLEDRIVKDVFKELSRTCVCPPNFPKCVCGHRADVKIVTKKPIVAGEIELKENSRSACAKLRVAEKI